MSPGGQDHQQTIAASVACAWLREPRSVRGPPRTAAGCWEAIGLPPYAEKPIRCCLLPTTSFSRRPWCGIHRNSCIFSRDPKPSFCHALISTLSPREGPSTAVDDPHLCCAHALPTASWEPLLSALAQSFHWQRSRSVWVAVSPTASPERPVFEPKTSSASDRTAMTVISAPPYARLADEISDPPRKPPKHRGTR